MVSTKVSPFADVKVSVRFLSEIRLVESGKKEISLEDALSKHRFALRIIPNNVVPEGMKTIVMARTLEELKTNIKKAVLESGESGHQTTLTDSDKIEISKWKEDSTDSEPVFTKSLSEINSKENIQIHKSLQGGDRENPKRKKRRDTKRKKRRDTRRKNTMRNKRKNTKRKSSKREYIIF